MTGLLDELIDRLDSMPPDQQAEVIRAATCQTGDMPWIPLPGPQSDAYFSEADELFYGGSAGGGKMQPVDSRVLTPTGWVEIGNLKPGSLICATDGTVTSVIGVYPHAQKDIYKITMSDGGTTEAGLEHNWLAWPANQSRRIANRITSGPASARKYTTAQIMEAMARHQQRFALPTPEPVRLNVAGQLKGRGNFIGRPLPPYLLGVLLGDGCITTKNITVTSADQEIITYLSELAGSDLRMASRDGNAAKSINFRGAFGRKLWVDIQALHLAGHRAGNKFIPRQYLFAPVPDRWELLRGLMDTDGWVEPGRAVYYTTISERLAQDVRHLALSLGGVVSLSEKMPAYMYKGIKKQGQKAYCLRIRIANPAQCFRLSRKKEVAQEISHQSAARFIEKIEFSRVSDAVCIEVAHRNSLYLTDDFIVTHNTDLALGMAINDHTKSLLLRRERDLVKDMFERMEEILPANSGGNAADLRYDFGEKTIRFNGVKNEHDKQKYKGRAYDYYCFDEIGDFLKSQYTFIITWNRSTVPGQRCRVLATGNPPTTAEGLWVIEYWGAWLDPKHPNPAKEGELRWYIMDKTGKQHEVNGRGPHIVEHEDGSTEELFARSRSFIRAWLKDNPYLAKTDYGAALDRLDPALRAAYRDGRFDLALEDNPRQVIPTQWILEAQKRWTPKPPAYIPMSAIGVDPAQGGPDETALAPRYDGWYAPLSVTPGAKTPNGAAVVAKIIEIRRDAALPIVDLGGGYGGATKEKLEDNQIPVEGFKPAGGSTARSNCKSYSFKNQRAQAYWKFREALDPSQPGGSQICLPDDPKLVADLSAPTFTISRGKNGLEILIESKEDIKERLGRSPDRGDAVVISWTSGAKSDSHGKIWHEAKQARMNGPRVVMGHQSQRRR